jgi:hypothetical protein
VLCVRQQLHLAEQAGEQADRQPVRVGGADVSLPASAVQLRQQLQFVVNQAGKQADRQTVRDGGADVSLLASAVLVGQQLQFVAHQAGKQADRQTVRGGGADVSLSANAVQATIRPRKQASRRTACQRRCCQLLPAATTAISVDHCWSKTAAI